MEKILIALHPAKINPNSIDFACYIARLTNSKLTALFLKNSKAAEVPVLSNAHQDTYMETILNSHLPENIESETQCEHNLLAFERACKNRGVAHTIHQEQGVLTEELIRESRFADLLILDAEMSFNDRPESLATSFVKEILSKSECPVVMAPYNFTEIDEIIFAYDNSASSMFAIKQFSYLLPEFGDKKLTVLQVDGDRDSPAFDNRKAGEFFQMHYSSIGYQSLRGNGSDELFEYLLLKKNAFVVVGAFGRNMLSAFFKRSTAELLIKTVNAPMFLTHC